MPPSTAARRRGRSCRTDRRCPSSAPVITKPRLEVKPGTMSFNFHCCSKVRTDALEHAQTLGTEQRDHGRGVEPDHFVALLAEPTRSTPGRLRARCGRLPTTTSTSRSAAPTSNRGATSVSPVNSAPKTQLATVAATRIGAAVDEDVRQNRPRVAPACSGLSAHAQLLDADTKHGIGRSTRHSSSYRGGSRRPARLHTGETAPMKPTNCKVERWR